MSFDLALRANVVPAPTVRFPLIPAGSDWRYLDDGSNQGPVWRTGGFDDTNWPTGTAQFGYGEGDEQTEINENRANGTRIRTFYFRREFAVNNASGVEGLVVRLQRDDGAAVYINGVEVVRDDLAANARFDDFATGTASGADEGRFFEFAVDPGVLVDGGNVVAVEVHQVNDTSSDVSFDLELVVEDVPSTLITLWDTGATWRYLDDGSNQGTAWQQADFNDANWPQGSAQLGYGDGDEATQLAENNATNARIRTYYFRRTIAVPDPSRIESLLVELLYDDGAAVYLNGVEVIRERLAPGAGFNDFASEDNPSENEFFSFEIPATALVAGINVVAAEVHQNSDTSSDVSFDMALRARQKIAEVDSYTFVLRPTDVGKTIGVYLAGTDESFANELLQLIDPQGTVIADSDTNTLAAENYDLAIRDVIAPFAGMYTVRLSSFARSDYGLLVTRDSVFEAESGAATPLEVGQVGFGFLGGDDAVDSYAVTLAVGQHVSVIAATPNGEGIVPPENEFDPALQVLAPDGTVIARDPDLPTGPPIPLELTADVAGVYTINVSSRLGFGDYTLRVSLPGDANLDGRVDGLDFNIWNANKFGPGIKVWTDADFNGDKVTDGGDFNIWNDNRFRLLPSAVERAALAGQQPPRAPLAARAWATPVDVDCTDDSISRREHAALVPHEVTAERLLTEPPNAFRHRRRVPRSDVDEARVNSGAANLIGDQDLTGLQKETVDWLFSVEWSKLIFHG